VLCAGLPRDPIELAPGNTISFLHSQHARCHPRSLNCCTVDFRRSECAWRLFLRISDHKTASVRCLWAMNKELPEEIAGSSIRAKSANLTVKARRRLIGSKADGRSSNPEGHGVPRISAVGASRDA
jgi:hypothetical protein